jgi:putative redox protein
MATVTPKSVVDMAMSATCPTHARSEISVRDVHAIIDEPEVRGGTNQGPTPTETLIAALIGCTNVIIHRVAEANDIKVEALAIDAAAKFDRRGVRLVEEIEVPFPAVTLTIDLTTAADDEALARVKADLGKYCPLSKVITNAGTELDVVWNISRP